jgi:hypothetical protein
MHSPNHVRFQECDVWPWHFSDIPTRPLNGAIGGKADVARMDQNRRE